MNEMTNVSGFRSKTKTKQTNKKTNKQRKQFAKLNCFM